jgi:hypothetical protein
MEVLIEYNNLTHTDISMKKIFNIEYASQLGEMIDHMKNEIIMMEAYQKGLRDGKGN